DVVDDAITRAVLAPVIRRVGRRSAQATHDELVGSAIGRACRAQDRSALHRPAASRGRLADQDALAVVAIGAGVAQLAEGRGYAAQHRVAAFFGGQEIAELFALVVIDRGLHEQFTHLVAERA